MQPWLVSLRSPPRRQVPVNLTPLFSAFPAKTHRCTRSLSEQGRRQHTSRSCALKLKACWHVHDDPTRAMPVVFNAHKKWQDSLHGGAVEVVMRNPIIPTGGRGPNLRGINVFFHVRVARVLRRKSFRRAKLGSSLGRSLAAL